MKELYIAVDGEEKGPYSISQLNKMWESGVITMRTLYWHEGMSGWEKVSDLMGDTEAEEVDSNPEPTMTEWQPTLIPTQAESLIGAPEKKSGRVADEHVRSDDSSLRTKAEPGMSMPACPKCGAIGTTGPKGTWKCRGGNCMYTPVAQEQGFEERIPLIWWWIVTFVIICLVLYGIWVWLDVGNWLESTLNSTGFWVVVGLVVFVCIFSGGGGGGSVGFSGSIDDGDSGGFE